MELADDWHTELVEEGGRWSFTLFQNGIWHSGGRNYRSRAAAIKAADWHRITWAHRPTLAAELAALGL